MQLAGICSLRTEETRDILASWSQEKKSFTGITDNRLLALNQRELKRSSWVCTKLDAARCPQSVVHFPSPPSSKAGDLDPASQESQHQSLFSFHNIFPLSKVEPSWPAAFLVLGRKHVQRSIVS